jgi:hypothetical protein
MIIDPAELDTHSVYKLLIGAVLARMAGNFSKIESLFDLPLDNIPE